MILLALLMQSAAPAAPTPPPPVPQRWSILTPVADEPCTRQSTRDAAGRDIIVCANPLPSQTLPYPDEVVPDGPTPSNKYRTGAGALAVEDGTPCHMSRSCVVGFGPPVLPIIKGAVGLVKGALAKKPDKRGRVAIALDGSDAPTGRLER